MKVINSLLAVCHWFRWLALVGRRIPARKPTEEDVSLETVELAVQEGRDNRLDPAELRLLAKRLAAASNPIEAAGIKERLMRGFYGI